MNTFVQWGERRQEVGLRGTRLYIGGSGGRVEVSDEYVCTMGGVGAGWREKVGIGYGHDMGICFTYARVNMYPYKHSHTHAHI